MSYDAESEYERLLPLYQSLAEHLRLLLEDVLKREQVDYLGVFSRIKSFEAFVEKAERRNYSQPFSQIQDICGLRVVCYYVSDLERIAGLIDSTFPVHDREDKTEVIAPIAFGYRSLHYVVSPPSMWSSQLMFDSLMPLKAEIQVRTILSHAWADIEHKLAYKKKEDIPRQFRRRLSILSALFELADNSFDELRRERESYIGKVRIISEQAKASGSVTSLIERNLDTLQTLLDSYFPDRGRSRQDTSVLLRQLETSEITMNALIQAYASAHGFLSELDRKVIEQFNWSEGLSQVAAVKLLIAIHDEKFFEVIRSTLPSFLVELVRGYSSQLRRSQ
jgi:putative GTP pyrophosphokinase